MLQRKGKEEVEEVTILELKGTEENGHRVFSHIRVWNEDEERKRDYAISRLAWLETPDGDELRTQAAIRLWLLEIAGVATDSDRETAGIEAADALASGRNNIEKVFARRLRLAVWIDYSDREGKPSRREITIVSLAGWDYDNETWEAQEVDAYCHLRKRARTFLVERITAIADTADGLSPMDHADVERWLRRKAGKETPDERQGH